jgi:predicted DNA-binding transcriptional regulator YafY
VHFQEKVICGKIDNMMVILWILGSGGKITAREISEKLEINIRTVYRYIDKLWASGISIISDTGHNGGYRLLQNLLKHLSFSRWRSKRLCFRLQI